MSPTSIVRSPTRESTTGVYAATARRARAATEPARFRISSSDELNRRSLRVDRGAHEAFLRFGRHRLPHLREYTVEVPVTSAYPVLGPAHTELRDASWAFGSARVFIAR